MCFEKIKKGVLLSITILFCVMSSLSYANTLETQISSEQVTLGDSIYITFLVNANSANDAPDFSILQKDFRILSRNYEKTVNIMNGALASQTFWRLQLQPLHAGEIIIPAINFGSDQSVARKLTVTSKQSITTKPDKLVFVRGEINTTSPYVQSQILYTFKLYFRTPLTDPRIEMPTLNDFTFFQLTDSPMYQTTLNGNVYNVVEKTFALFPKKSGSLKIPSFQFHAMVVDDQPNPYNDPFNFNEPKSESSATNAINLSVRDVPANFQGKDWLPAQHILMSEQWSDARKQWESGSPITRTITIEAQGLRADQLPDLTIPNIKGVNVYLDRPKRSNRIQNEMVVGVYEQKVTYIPNDTQAFTIPAIKLNWWNTRTDSNAIAQLNEVSIQVKTPVLHSNTNTNANTHSALNEVQSSQSSQPIANQPLPISTKTYYASAWFWVACLLFIAWMMTLWFMMRKKSIKREAIPVRHSVSTEISENHFEEACLKGQATLAQQYLLEWSKVRWPNTALNLSTLRDLIADEALQCAIEELERALYDKKAGQWNGESLLMAFQRVIKSGKSFGARQSKAKQDSKQQMDPLPPLNPV